MRKTLRVLTVTAVAALTGLATIAPAWADTLLERQPWACEEPYSGELECGPAMLVPPGAYLWIGSDTPGPTIYKAYQGEGPGQVQIGYGEMFGAGGAFRLWTNNTDAAVLVHITEHADAPEDRCGTVFESGFYEVRK